ncbi:hypothetical protein T265_00634 [Opisthorchis viverrini]|uniref:Uncharacterized protein n=1 Tax=Opisthorchis viverrini TaxID=6198 RepID=A0A075A5E7_OPIVI|nr:hypothetical protein T265_00634 [Opisthorchis viverrini]KER33522.1 hypothetical protein T265_00634 [Opisthorchis viverrini]
MKSNSLSASRLILCKTSLRSDVKPKMNLLTLSTLVHDVETEYTLLDSTTADQSLVYNSYWPEAVSNPSKSNIMGQYEAELPPCPTDDPRGLARRLTVREFRVTLRRCAAGRDL